MRVRSTPRVSFAAILAAVGCAEGGVGLPEPTVVDSAGVRIVRYDLRSVPLPPFATVVEPDLVIGSIEGPPEYTFSRIADLAVAEDGRLIVSDGVAQELRVYGADGDHLRTLGGSGEGPGEFAMAPTIAGLARDTVFAFDGRSDRVTTLTMEGRLLSTVSVRGEGIGRPQAMLRLDDGTYLSQSSWSPTTGVQSFYDVRVDYDSIVIEHLDAGAGLIDTVAVSPDRPRARSVRDRGGGVMSVIQAPVPYAPRSFVASDGRRAITAYSASFVIELVDPDGGTRLRLVVEGVEHPASAADIRARQEERLREDFGDDEIPPMVRLLNIDLLPDRLPAFAEVIVSDGGDVWVARSTLDDSEGLEWLVFASEGALRGTVRTPPGLQLRAIHGEALVGVVLDELDVPYVHRYPLGRVEPGR